jgi:serine protease Do
MAKAGQMERSNQVFQTALQAAQEIEDARFRSQALKGIAEALAKAGQKERANQAFQLSLQAAQKIEKAGSRSQALSGIAKALAKAGQIDRAVKVAEMIDDPIERLQAFAAIMAAKQKAGKGEAGRE